MQIPLSTVNIVKTKVDELLTDQDWLGKILSGNFYEFEQLLHKSILSLYDKICEELISLVSKTCEFINVQKELAKELAKELGLKRLTNRICTIQLRTGTKIAYESLYAKQAPDEYVGTRHLSLRWWKSEAGGSPMYKSLSCLFSVLCPSFGVAKSLLNYQGIGANFDRIRSLSLALAEQVMQDRASIQLAPNETLADKRVVIAIDGGRSRTRVYEEGQAGRDQKYDTPWREPKLFVITTANEKGEVNKEELPIYDASFGDDETFELLAQYLERLEIHRAKSVQFLGDGAPWIWNRARPMLLRLGVAAEKIIETLDYYHAMEHLHELKVYFDCEESDSVFTHLKVALWKGDIQQMGQLIKKGISKVTLDEFNPFKYFWKQRNRIDYQRLKDENLPCGSGIVESGIRRIINLRFKSPSSFWYPENLEKLIFMRAIALSGRWNIMMNNFHQFCALFFIFNFCNGFDSTAQ